MDFSTLYYMSDAMTRGAFRAEPDDITIDAIGIARSEALPETPMIFRHFMGGGNPKDLLGTGFASLILLCDRVIEILRAGGYSGWTTYPIELYEKKGERMEGYHGFGVTGRCGPVLWEKGKKIRKPPPVPKGQGYDAWLGLYFDPDTWDGSDVFMPKDSTAIIVIEPIMQALTRAKVKNFKFQPLTEFERTWDL